MSSSKKHDEFQTVTKKRRNPQRKQPDNKKLITAVTLQPSVPKFPDEFKHLGMPSQLILPSRPLHRGDYVPQFDTKTNRCWWEWADREYDGSIDLLEERLEQAWNAFHDENKRREALADAWRAKYM